MKILRKPLSTPFSQIAASIKMHKDICCGGRSRTDK